MLADGYLCANLPEALPRLIATGKPSVWISDASGTRTYPHVLADPVAELKLVWEHFQKENLQHAGLFVSHDPRDDRHPPPSASTAATRSTPSACARPATSRAAAAPKK